MNKNSKEEKGIYSEFLDMEIGMIGSATEAQMRGPSKYQDTTHDEYSPSNN